MEGYVRKTPYLELSGSYGSGTAAFAALREHPVDLLFCDIQMPGLNGMELSRMLPEETRVIFTTAFSQYAVEGFRVQAMDYLLKPISYNDFLSAANKALAWFELKRRAEQAGPGEPSTSAAPSDAGEETTAAASELPPATVRTQEPHAEDPRRSLIVKTEYRLQQRSSFPGIVSSAYIAPISCSRRKSARSSATGSCSTGSGFRFRRTTGSRSTIFSPAMRCFREVFPARSNAEANPPLRAACDSSGRPIR